MTSPKLVSRPDRVSGPGPMTGQAPLLTIGVPVYNGGSMLAESLQSLQDQTFTAFKVIICDNASTDDTPEICRGFTAADPRFEYHRNPTNIGAHPNFNRVFELGHSTKYFKWAAHDDIHAPTFLERCLELLESDQTAVLSYSITVLIDELQDPLAPDRMGLRHNVIDSFVDAKGRQAWTIGPLHLCEGDDPAQRLHQYLRYNTSSFQIFGVIRTSAMLSTSLHGSYYGADRSFLSQLVLIGRFRQVPEPLYFNRTHRAASRNLNQAARRLFVDTKGASRWWNFLMYRDIFFTTLTIPLPIISRIFCVFIVMNDFMAWHINRLIKVFTHKIVPRFFASTVTNVNR